MGELSVWHWLIVGAVATMLFGANRLPDIARSVGRSMRIFQSELRGIQNDGGTRVVDETASATLAAPADAGQPGAGPAGGGPVAAGPAGGGPVAARPVAAGPVGGGGAVAAGAAAEGGQRRPGAQ
jgi:sec-independent protein translocase protein TatA